MPLFLQIMLDQKLTPLQALPKVKYYCTYQDRCHNEVKDKLYGFGLNKSEVDMIVSTLIEEDYLNEERFAIMFAGGHFRTKHWGRVKIIYELKKKMVSEYCIKKALAGIDDQDYLKSLNKLAGIKLMSLKSEKNIFIKKKKLRDHLIMKGYERDLVYDVVNAMEK